MAKPLLMLTLAVRFYKQLANLVLVCIICRLVGSLFAVLPTPLFCIDFEHPSNLRICLCPVLYDQEKKDF